MRIFLDTEFTDFINIDLISIAMVSEDGQHEFYAERNDYRDDFCNAFVRVAVLPLLGTLPRMVVNRDELALNLREWFDTLPPWFILLSEHGVDYELLMDALDGKRPENLASIEGAEAINYDEVCRYHAEPNQPWHHALHDARALRVGWLTRQHKKRRL